MSCIAPVHNAVQKLLSRSSKYKRQNLEPTLLYMSEALKHLKFVTQICTAYPVSGASWTIRTKTANDFSPHETLRLRGYPIILSLNVFYYAGIVGVFL